MFRKERGKRTIITEGSGDKRRKKKLKV